jgi:hypothetical protein
MLCHGRIRISIFKGFVQAICVFKLSQNDVVAVGRMAFADGHITVTWMKNSEKGQKPMSAETGSTLRFEDFKAFP